MSTPFLMLRFFLAGGKDYFGGPLTRFDIPLLWSSLGSYPEYRWGGFNVPGVVAGKGEGGVRCKGNVRVGCMLEDLMCQGRVTEPMPSLVKLMRLC